jgi:hypothetical protein
MAIVGIPAVGGIPTHLKHEGMQCSGVILWDSSALRTRKPWALCAWNLSVGIESECSPWNGEHILNRLNSCSSRFHAGVGFAFDEMQGRYIVKPYED